MTSKILCLAVAVLLPEAVSAATVEPARSDLTVWRSLVEQRSLPALLEEARLGHLPAWPNTASSADRSPRAPEAKAEQVELRRLAGCLGGKLVDFRAVLQSAAPQDFLRDAGALLQLRDAVAARPAYVNLLLADSVNRLLFVAVARRMAADGTASPEIQALVSRLRSFTVNPADLAARVEEERGAPVVTKEGAEKAAPGVLFYSLLGALTGGLEHGLFLATQGVENLELPRMIEQPDWGRLLYRLWLTDQKIGIVLPLTAEYARKAGRVSAGDGYDKVRSTLALTDEDRRRFDTALNQTSPMVTYDVTGLLDSVRTNTIDLQLLLGSKSDADRICASKGPREGP